MFRQFRRRFCHDRSLLADNSGASLVEFVLVVPIAFAFIGLLIFAGQGFEVGGKVNLTARTVANLVTQQTSVTMATLNCLLVVATNAMTPFDTSSGLTISATEIQVDSTGTKGTVIWSYAAINHGSSRAVGSTVAVTAGGLPTGSYQIYVEVSYAITPPTILGNQNANLTLRRSVFLQPRNGSSIQCTDCPTS